MKKSILLIVMLVSSAVALQAKPVDVSTAQNLGRSFVKTNFEFTRQSDELTLVQTLLSDRGEACCYIFDVGETGFVIIAADDHYRPIIGYSDEGRFPVDDMAPAMVDYLESIRQGVMEAAEAPSASVSVSNDWTMLQQTGRLVSRHGGRDDEYLVETKWNQNYPYNICCPLDAAGPGGHVYAGCVATAAAQLMRYWCHPLQGQGSYTYIPETNPQYGPQTANFGETTYDWENMPISIGNNSPTEQLEAVGTLIYHAGVSVDMNYKPSGSGAVTTQLCNVMPLYFYYTDQMVNIRREDHTHESYMQLLIEAIDMSWPMVHRGGGHAYVLDGYNDYDQVHFNWGWSGSGDGWFDIDDHGYTDGESVIYNYVPAERYAATSAAPTDLEVIPSTDKLLSAMVTWKNPTQTLTGLALETIDQIVVARNGQVIYAQDGVAPGEEMSFLDETIPYFDSFDYAVYAIIDGQRGASATLKNVLVTPSCDWKMVMQSTSMQGWNGGHVSLYSITGREIQRMTITNSTPATLDFTVPLGHVRFGWTASNNPSGNMAILIKDAGNNTVYTYTGAASAMEEGIFLNTNNGCDNAPITYAPYGLLSSATDEGVLLTWTSDFDPQYGFNVFRDGYLYALVNEGTARTYLDESYGDGHCYTVRALDAGGESEESNESCASMGDCMGATNFDFTYVGDNYRIKLMWEKPEPHDGLSGYYLYRKDGEDGTYERIRLLGASSTSYIDNSANVEGDYYYRLYAYYSAIDCTSAPASIKDDPNKFYLKVYYSPTEVAESVITTDRLFPNPADQNLRVEADGLTRVTVYNALGQLVCQMECEGNGLNINASGWSEGVYLLKLQTVDGVLPRRVMIAH